MSVPGPVDRKSVKSRGQNVAPIEAIREAHAFILSHLNERRFVSKRGNKFTPCEIKDKSERLLNQIKLCLAEQANWIESHRDEAAEMIETCVTVADYYDNVPDQRHAWLFSLTRDYFDKLLAGSPSVAQDCLEAYFRLALTHLQIDYRRRSTDHLKLQERFAHLEPYVSRLHERKTANAYRLLRRYYHLRAHVVRLVPERYQADRFLDLAASYADLEARLTSDPKVATAILTEKIIMIGLTRVWLLISVGHYHHAQQLLTLINTELDGYESDAISYAKYLVAKNICLRALAGRDPKRLQQVIKGLTDALAIFGELEDRRHLLRCYYERSMCFLLLGKLDRLASDLKFMESYAHAGGENRRLGWQVQTNILRSRLHCQLGDYIQGESDAAAALSLAANVGLDLLTIEAKNTLAMVMFRQGKLFEAESQLSDALRLNHEGLHQTDHGDLSQPALCGVSLLYLARVALLKDDLISALALLHKWRVLSTRVEHQWVRTLAAEVEHQALHNSLFQQTGFAIDNDDFESHLRLLRKVMIERVSRKQCSKKIIDIARGLGVKRQTIHNWLKDLKDHSVPVHF